MNIVACTAIELLLEMVFYTRSVQSQLWGHSVGGVA
jgi:hypothetical protein